LHYSAHANDLSSSVKKRHRLRGTQIERAVQHVPRAYVTYHGQPAASTHATCRSSRCLKADPVHLSRVATRLTAHPSSNALLQAFLHSCSCRKPCGISSFNFDHKKRHIRSLPPVYLPKRSAHVSVHFANTSATFISFPARNVVRRTMYNKYLNTRTRRLASGHTYRNRTPPLLHVYSPSR